MPSLPRILRLESQSGLAILPPSSSSPTRPTIVVAVSLANFTVDAVPFATTASAQLFRARLRTATKDPVVVVIKSACPAYASDDVTRELRVATQLTNQGGHPNVVHYFGAFVEDGAAHLVMECCRRGDLFTQLEHSTNQCFPPVEALDALLQIVRGLQFLHRCNIAHRDLSIENVLVGDDGNYKLCDFGLSTAADQRSVAIVGTPHCMAPEVVARQAYDPVCADIWSLGVLFFMLLTGSPLVKIASASARDFCTFQLLGVGGVLELWKMRECCSLATLELLDGMLQIEPTRRFQNVDEILRHDAMRDAVERRRLVEDEARVARQ